MVGYLMLTCIYVTHGNIVVREWSISSAYRADTSQTIPKELLEMLTLEVNDS